MNKSWALRAGATPDGAKLALNVEVHAPAHIQAASLVYFILASNAPKNWAALVDRTIPIHGKSYGVSKDLVEVASDYQTILPRFRDGGFTGALVKEWEGHAYGTRDAFEQVERHQAMCRKIFAKWFVLGVYQRLNMKVQDEGAGTGFIRVLLFPEADSSPHRSDLACSTPDAQWFER